MKTIKSIQKDIEEFERQLNKGSLQRAYRALLSYMMELRTYFKNKHPSFSVSALYQGYMDMTYFAVCPKTLSQRDLKIAIVFHYEAFCFEAWLAGKNRKINRQYWELFKDKQWPGYRFVKPDKGVDSIVECDLVKGFEPGDTEGLTARIETGVCAFIKIIEACLQESLRW
jgi:hypothetical protein